MRIYLTFILFALLFTACQKPEANVGSDTAKRYADLGVHRLIPFPRAKTEQIVQDFIKQSADTLVGRI